MTQFIVIRPQPACDATVRGAREMGLDASGHPLFDIRALDWQAPDPATFDGLLIGSANAVRQGGAALARYHGMPAYAVGEATAAAVRDAGMDLASVGDRGLQSLLGSLEPGHKRLLRLTARERVTLVAPPGVSITEVVTYASEPQDMRQDLADLLAGGAVVLLHSGEAARHFAAQCEARQIARSKVAVAALAPRIAGEAGTGWAAIAAAPVPRDQALLALAGRMCQSGGGFEP